MDLSAVEVLQAVKTIPHVTVKFGGDLRAGVSASNTRAQQVIKALKITDLRLPTAQGATVDLCRDSATGSSVDNAIM